MTHCLLLHTNNTHMKNISHSENPLGTETKVEFMSEFCNRNWAKCTRNGSVILKGRLGSVHLKHNVIIVVVTLQSVMCSSAVVLVLVLMRQIAGGHSYLQRKML